MEVIAIIFVLELVFFPLGREAVQNIEVSGSLSNIYDGRICVKAICGALHDLVPFVQFKKREKHPWRSVNFVKL